MRRSVQLADEARAIAQAERDGERPLLVAASIGPYGAFLADGSEYRGRYGLSVSALRDFHRARMETLLAAGPDLLAIETIPEIEEGQALVDLVAELGGRAWLSFTCADGAHLRSGAPVEEALALAGDAEGVIAVGINCTAPGFARELVARAAAVTDKAVIVYPNSGEDWDPVGRRWVGSGELVDAGAAEGWVAAGARLIGGCCRVTPAQIGEVAAALRAAA
jgi:S-methylmethionine-dependent homocysteine/selenocysteine methylase